TSTLASPVDRVQAAIPSPNGRLFILYGHSSFSEVPVHRLVFAYASRPRHKPLGRGTDSGSGSGGSGLGSRPGPGCIGSGTGGAVCRSSDIREPLHSISATHRAAVP